MPPTRTFESCLRDQRWLGAAWASVLLAWTPISDPNEGTETHAVKSREADAGAKLRDAAGPTERTDAGAANNGPIRVDVQSECEDAAPLACSLADSHAVVSCKAGS